ncbi:hypothetical protein TI05_11200 [Achromatium sp. WMS3]|nr:hypothetical protein TI05_11200 [Achromatium sp. WMS3]
MHRFDFYYWPYYCEENIWLLCQEPCIAKLSPQVVFISNPEQRCIFTNQRLNPQKYVIWDYHVILLIYNYVWDFDSVLPFPCPLADYLEHSFPADIPPGFAPRFRIIKAHEYITCFASDRRHMKDANGNYKRPPPPWNIRNHKQVFNLDKFINMQPGFLGSVLSLHQLQQSGTDIRTNDIKTKISKIKTKIDTEFTNFFDSPASYRDKLEINWLRNRSPLITHEKELVLVRNKLNFINSEYCCGFTYDPEFIAKACYLGFLPMTEEIAQKDVLIIKSHRKRCLLKFENLHISKNVLKRSKKYLLTINKAYDACITHINMQHDKCWVRPQYVAALKQIRENKFYKVTPISFELWDQDEMVAGEIGYQVGACYTSLSGFYTQNSAGTIQLCATAKLLEASGFLVWDLGMVMDYKLKLGAQSVSWNSFLNIFYQARKQQCEFLVDNVNAQDVIKNRHPSLTMNT